MQDPVIGPILLDIMIYAGTPVMVATQAAVIATPWITTAVLLGGSVGRPAALLTCRRGADC